MQTTAEAKEQSSNKNEYDYPFLKKLHLIKFCIENNIIMQDPNNKDNIIVYYSAGTNNPEGWYSVNIHSAASDMDTDDVKYIVEALRDKGLEFVSNADEIIENIKQACEMLGNSNQ